MSTPPAGPPTQLSLFSAQTRTPAIDDLEGLLLGPGQLVRRDRAARLSVVVADPWRVESLLAAMDALGLAGDAVTHSDGGTSVRTPFTVALGAVAGRWQRGAVKWPPTGLAVDGHRLRWWCIAAGAGEVRGYLLGLGPREPQVWPAVGSALAGAGVPGTFVGSRASGPAYRIVGDRRLRRLAELVGPPPAGAPPEQWPR
jgi:hypothetical protein